MEQRIIGIVEEILGVSGLYEKNGMLVAPNPNSEDYDTYAYFVVTTSEARTMYEVLDYRHSEEILKVVVTH